MKAQNLTISIPNKGCDKNCPYCVSKMTGYMESNMLLMEQNLNKVKTIAKIANISSVLITSKGEPCLNMDNLMFFIERFNDWPIELQTNGIFLNSETQILRKPKDGIFQRKSVMNKALLQLKMHRLNVIAFSIDDIDMITEYRTTFHMVRELGMLVRVTLNITNKLSKDLSFDDIIKNCHSNFVDQFSLRQITVPEDSDIEGEPGDGVNWIIHNVGIGLYEILRDDMIKKVEEKGRLIMTLPYGTKVYDYEGISVTYFNECIQETNHSDDIRSLIFQEDGHLYTSWNSKASKLF